MANYRFTDIVNTSIPFSPSIDFLLFDAGYEASQLFLLQEGTDVRVQYGAQSILLQSISLAQLQGNQFTFADGGLVILGSIDIDTLTGSSLGDSIYGLDGSDTIYGDAGNDCLLGGLGNDTLTGGAGNDVYLVAKGDGIDTIDNYDDTNYFDPTAGKIDTVRFVDVLSTEVTALNRVNSDLVIDYGTTDKLTITNYFVNPYFQIEQFQFSDGISWDANHFNNLAAPQITDTRATLSEGTEDNAYVVSVNELLQGYTGVNNGILSIVGLSSDNGTVFYNDDYTYTILPTPNYNGVVRLSYTVSDGINSTPASLSYNIVAINDEPFLTGTAATLVEGIEDNSYIVSVADLLQGYTDVDNDILTIVNLQSDNGTLLDNGNGTYTILPTSNFNGPVTLTYYVSDGITDSPASLTYNISAVNDLPTYPIADGKVITGFLGAFSAGYSVTVQPDGKILVAGNSGGLIAGPDITVVRYNTDGSLDTSFDGDGKVTTNFDGNSSDYGKSVAIQSDGKILVSGYSQNSITHMTELVVVRFNIDGSLDTSFDADGKLAVNFGNNHSEGNSVTVQSDGKILVAGYSVNTVTQTSDFALVRLNSDGSLDASFDADGKVIINFTGASSSGESVTVQADGKIIVAGSSYNLVTGTSDFTLIRLNSDGSLDAGFDADGKVTINFTGASSSGQSVTIQGDGKILVAGSSYNPVTDTSDFALIRLNSDGSLDAGFDADGKVNINFGDGGGGESVTVQADGKILVAGNSYNPLTGNNDFALVRFNGDGSLDTSFDGDGKVNVHLYGNGQAHSVTVQTDGKILVAGSGWSPFAISNGSFSLLRFNSDGSLDTTFDGYILNGAPSYLENNPAVVLDSSVQIYDAELAAQGHYAGASISLERHAGADNQDIFTGSGQLSFSNGYAVLSGVTIGTVSNSNGLLTITFNSNATQIRVDETLSSIAYSNSSNTPPASVQIDWTFNDGNSSGLQGVGGALTAIGSTIVNITAINDAPVQTGTVASLVDGVANTSYLVTASDLLQGYTDSDNAILNITGLSADHGIVTDNGNGTYTINPDLNYSGLVNLSFNVTDGIASTAGVLGFNIPSLVTSVIIDTTINGLQSYISQIGEPNTLSYGQTFITPDLINTTLNSFTFYIDPTGPNDTKLQGFLGTWTGSNVGSILWSSNAITMPASAGMTPETFAGIDINLIANQQYVFFISAANVLDSLSDSANVAGENNGYSNGSFVYLNHSVFNDVLTNNWTTNFTPNDMEFIATFSNNVLVNHAPELTGPTAVLPDGLEDQTYTVTAAELLQGFTDADGDVLFIQPGTVDVDSVIADNGTVVESSDGTYYTITPNANYQGPINLYFAVSDGTTTTPATVSYEVLPVNDAPIAVTDALTATEDTAVIYTAAQLLGNDTDVDSLNLTLASVASGSNGHVVLNQDGTVTFTPAANFNGIANFSYIVTDGSTLSNSATVSVTVSAINDASTFSVGDSKITLDIHGISRIVAELADGKILVDSNDLNLNLHTLTRYNSDGSLDSSFDLNGNFKLIAGNILTVASDGKILVATPVFNPAGGSDYSLNRYNADGSQDSSFVSVDLAAYNQNQYQFNSRQILEQADGKTLVFGFMSNFNNFFGSMPYPAIMRYNSDGSLDSSFGDFMSHASTDITPNLNLLVQNINTFVDIDAVALQADGKILMSISGGPGRTFLIRYDNNGNLDLNFSGGAQLITDEIMRQNIIIQTDGRILLGGDTFDPIDFTGAYELLRYNGDGSLDTSFNSTGKVLIHTLDGIDKKVICQADGKILVSGSTHNASTGNSDIELLRYNSDGTLDTTFGVGGSLSTRISVNSQDFTLDVIVQSDGKILLLGLTQGLSLDATSLVSKSVLVRFNSDGSLDASFDAVNTLNGSPTYIENGIAVVLDSTVQIYDAELAAQGHYAGASISLERHAGADNQDIFTGSGQLSFSNGDAVLSGITIGTVSNSNGLLTIIFNSNATQVRVDEVLSSIAYSNSSDTPPASVQIDWTFNDANNSGLQGTGGALTAIGSTIINVTATAINDAPVLTGTTAVLPDGQEDQTYTVTAVELLKGFTDADGDVLFIQPGTLDLDSVIADNGTVVESSDGTYYTITPNANYYGPVNLYFAVSDGTTTTPATVSYEVLPVNDAPELTDPIALLPDGLEDQAYVVTTADLLQGFTDVDGDVLFIQPGTLDLDSVIADNGIVVENNDGTYTITPNANYFGVINLYYTVTDGVALVPATASYQVLPVNDAPQLTEAPAVLVDGLEDTDYTVSAADLLLGYTDVENDPLSVVALSADNGVVLDNGNGTYTITPFANFNGVINLSYSVSDGLENTLASQSYQVLAVNDAPELTGEQAVLAEGLEDTAYIVSAADLLLGYTDVDTDVLSVIDLTADHGSVTALGDGLYSIQPTVNYNGPMLLSYSISDGYAATPATLSYNLLAVNDAPELTGSLASLADGLEGSDYSVSASDLLAGYTDVDGDLLSVINLSADHGSVLDNGDGTYTITPAVNYAGTVTLSYEVNDGTDSAVATQSFELLPANHAPVLVTPLVDQAVKYNTADWSYDAGSHFTDTDAGDTLTFSASLANGAVLPAWLSIDSSTGLLSGTPGLTDIASLLITVVATDLSGVATPTTFTVAATAFNAGQLLVSTAGNDTLTGNTSNDTASYAYAGAGVTVSLATTSAQNTVGAGSDTLTGIENLIGSNLNDRLTGNTLSNTLFGGTGVDTLVGGGGNDTFIVNITATGTLEDTVTAGTGLDTLQVFGTYAGAGATLSVLGTAIDNVDISTTGTSLLNLTGSISANNLLGNAANNTLSDGGVGGLGDTLIGGLGNDTYTVNNSTDSLVEALDEGTDTVNSAVTFSLLTNGQNVENLTLTGIAVINGTGNSLANVITGNASINTLSDGGIGGADTLSGAAGNDTYLVNNTGDSIIELAGAPAGTDLINSTVSFDLNNAANVENLTLLGVANLNATGNAVANSLTGNAGNNSLTGGAGVDTLIGGGGNDTYVVNITTTGTLEDTVTGNTGIDTVNVVGNYTGVVRTLIAAATTIENYDISGTGTALLNVTGNVLTNRLTGNAANNLLSDGGVGGLGDTLTGGAGNDTYTVTNSTDILVELSGEGTDLVNSAVSFNLLTKGANVENITLTGATAINAIGNDLNNILTGNTGINTLTGGQGDDVYVVQTIGDVVIEVLDEGRDVVNSAISFTLGANLEELSLTGTLAINGTGNTLANVITGNAGVNTLNDGGIGGSDTLTGGAGNDIYVVNNTGDSIIEATGTVAGATDLIRSTVSFDLNNAANVESLTLIGVANLNALGNSVANTLTGNAGNNVLTGGAGVDSLIGGGGNDTYVVNITAAGALEDAVTGNTGIDTLQVIGTSINAAATLLTAAATIENYDISGTGSSLLNLTGNALANTLTGNAANNILNGGAGVDTLIGGGGNDTYTVDNGSDVVTENAAQGTDLVNSSVTYTLAVNVENLTLTGTTAINGTGNNDNNILTGNSGINTLLGNDGNDILIGKAGNDRLTGGAGVDTFWFDTTANATTNRDTITDFASGTDKLQFSVSVLTALGATGQFIANDQRFWSNTTGLAHDATDRLIYNTTTGILNYDSNGSAAGGAVQLELLGATTHPGLAATDLWVA